MTRNQQLFNPNDRVNNFQAAHLLGISLVLLLTTFPISFPRAKMIGDFPLHVSLFLLVYCSLVLKGKLKSNLRITLNALLIILVLFSLRVFYSAESFTFGLIEINNLFMSLLVFVAFAKCNFHELIIALIYIRLAIFISAITSVLFYFKLIVPDSARNIIRLVDVANVSYGSTRVVTQTLILAIAYIIISIAYFGVFGRRRHFVHILTFCASTIIIILAQSRLIVISIITLLFILIYIKSAKVIIQLVLKPLLMGLILLIFISPFATHLSQSSLYDSLRGATSRITAGLQARTDISADPSALYRVIENELAVEAIKENLVWGLGFGVPYTPYTLSKGNGWLSVYGGYYTHNTIYWLCLKFGILLALGILILLFFSLRLSRFKLTEEQFVIKSSTLAIIAFMPFWNLFAGLSESLILLSLLGLSHNPSFGKHFRK